MTATAITLTQVKAGLLFDTGEKWASETITFSIPGLGSTWEDGYGNGEPTDPLYSTFNTVQANNFRKALGIWDSYIDNTFKEVSDSVQGNIRVAFSDVDLRLPGAAAYAFTPPAPGVSPTPSHGDIWVDDIFSDVSFGQGSFGFSVLLHEAGHTLGLKHPFQNPTLPAKFDNTTYSIMSYASQDVRINFTVIDGAMGYSTSDTDVLTPMVLDIMAIQAHYGADKTTASGNTTYTFLDGQLEGRRAIYDAGGTDTINLSKLSRGSNLDLRPGAYSDLSRYSAAQQIADNVARYGEDYRASITSAFASETAYLWERNLGIAFSTVIENGTGTNKADSITGNSVGNILRGLDGADRIIGGMGNDILAGGLGADRFIFGNGFDRDRISDFRAAKSGNDIIDLKAVSSITSWADLTASHLSTVNGNAVINAGNGDVITLVGVSVSQLHDYNFLF